MRGRRQEHMLHVVVPGQGAGSGAGSAQARRRLGRGLGRGLGRTLGAGSAQARAHARSYGGFTCCLHKQYILVLTTGSATGKPRRNGGSIHYLTPPCARYSALLHLGASTSLIFFSLPHTAHRTAHMSQHSLHTQSQITPHTSGSAQSTAAATATSGGLRGRWRQPDTPEGVGLHARR